MSTFVTRRITINRIHPSQRGGTRAREFVEERNYGKKDILRVRKNVKLDTMRHFLEKVYKHYQVMGLKASRLQTHASYSQYSLSFNGS